MKKIGLWVGVLVTLWGCTPSPASQSNAATPAVAGEDAAEASPAPCQEAEYRQLDFWVGTWDLTWANPDGSEGQGVNVISRSPFGACVITEQFDGNPGLKFKGMSVSTYSKPHKRWRQTWVDDQGSYISLYGELQDDGTFQLDMERLDDVGPFNRMIFEDIQADSLTWRWQGKAKSDDPWADQWVIQYARRN